MCVCVCVCMCACVHASVRACACVWVYRCDECVCVWWVCLCICVCAYVTYTVKKEINKWIFSSISIFSSHFKDLSNILVLRQCSSCTCTHEQKEVSWEHSGLSTSWYWLTSGTLMVAGRFVNLGGLSLTSVSLTVILMKLSSVPWLMLSRAYTSTSCSSSTCKPVASWHHPL